MQSNTLAAALAATIFLTAGFAYAANEAMKPAQTQAQAAATKDAGKLSADGSRGYVDIALTRLAIFDGRIDDAKKFISEADTAFDKAKSDESVFMKAEADLQASDQAGKPASGGQSSAEAEAAQAKMNAIKQENSANVYAGGKGDNAAAAGQAPGTMTPKRWLPVDAEMSLSEDFTANPQKAAAVAEANKKLDKGDKGGAMATLKLADVDIDYAIALVPLDQTLADIHKAAQLVNVGKYYEASQLLHQVQDSTRYDLIEVSGAPGAKAATTVAH